VSTVPATDGTRDGAHRDAAFLTLPGLGQVPRVVWWCQLQPALDHPASGPAGASGYASSPKGVENQRTLDHLAAICCDYVQGYYLSRPLTAADLTAWLIDRRALVQLEIR
jgi:hypothetical protein